MTFLWPLGRWHMSLMCSCIYIYVCVYMCFYPNLSNICVASDHLDTTFLCRQVVLSLIYIHIYLLWLYLLFIFSTIIRRVPHLLIMLVGLSWPFATANSNTIYMTWCESLGNNMQIHTKSTYSIDQSYIADLLLSLSLTLRIFPISIPIQFSLT